MPAAGVRTGGVAGAHVSSVPAAGGTRASGKSSDSQRGLRRPASLWCYPLAPVQPLQREWGYQATSQRAGEAAWEARQVPEGLSCPFVHGATQDEGSRCQAPGRRWRDPWHVCLRASARGSALATRVGCRSWGL